MTTNSAARLLVLLLLPVIFGCQMKTKGMQEESLAPKEEVSREQSSRSDGITAAVLKSQDDKIAYSIGLDAGTDLQKLELNLNSIPHLIQGIKDSLLGNEPLLTDEERQQVRSALLSARAAARSSQLGPQAEKNLAEGKLFLQENAKKEGVKVLPSGLQYRVISEGVGATPQITDTVKIHYSLRSLDGKEMKSSYRDGNPVVIPANAGIPAWREALQLMKVKDKWELFVPGHLAYGERGVSDMVGPYQPVIFELELIGIE